MLPTVHDGKQNFSGRSSDFRIVLPLRLPFCVMEKVAFLLGLSPVTAAGPSSNCTKFPFQPVMMALSVVLQGPGYLENMLIVLPEIRVFVNLLFHWGREV